MKAASLRFRLLLGAAAVIVLALAGASVAIVLSFQESIEHERRSDMEAQLDRLIAYLDPQSPDLVPGRPLADPRYETPLSGLYWQIDDLAKGGSVRSRSMWDGTLDLGHPSAPGPAELSQTHDSTGQPLIVLSRAISVETADGPRLFNVAIAEAREDPDNPLAVFGTTLALALALVGVVLFGAAALQLHFGLIPLRRLRNGIEAIRTGRAERLGEAYAREVLPVVNEVNDLLAGQEAAVGFARERAADLAHGLKTPLAVLASTADRMRAAGDAENADVVEMLTQEMNSRIEYQLRLARLRFRTQARGVQSSLNSAVLRSVSVLRRTSHGEMLNWQVDLEENIEVDVDEHDLIELVGVVLENAAKWAKTRVNVSCRKAGGMAEIEIEDDGIGLSDDQIAQLGPRGKRMDESRPGEGLGLAIVFDILKLNRGTVHLDRSALGGLRVHLTLPLHAK